MSYHDLEAWDYYEDGYTAWYVSSSRTIIIIKDPQADNAMNWFWRVYDNGIPNLDGYGLVMDESWDHDLRYFASPMDAYADVVEKGMERTGY